MLITVVLGTATIWSTVQFTKRQFKEKALERAVIIAQAINKKRLARLQGTADDILSTDYQRLKEQLFGMRCVDKSCRFLYIMGRKKDGTVFFFLDSQTMESKDYAPPGLIYVEVPEEYFSL